MRDQRDNRDDRRERKFDSKAIQIRRVAKVTAGGKRLRFSAMSVVGNHKGSVGVGLGRGVDTRSAITKAENKAEKDMVKIEVVGDTIPHEIVHKKGAAKVMLRPAKPGTGVIAGSSVRTVLELCGIENVYGKILGSSDIIANAYCTFEALQLLRSERVLRKMHKMKDRIELKEKMDKERAVRETKRRQKEAKEGRGKGDGRGDRRGRGGDNRHPRKEFKRAEKPAEAVKPAEVAKPAEAAKPEATEVAATTEDKK